MKYHFLRWFASREFKKESTIKKNEEEERLGKNTSWHFFSFFIPSFYFPVKNQDNALEKISHYQVESCLVNYW